MKLDMNEKAARTIVFVLGVAVALWFVCALVQIVRASGGSCL